MLNILEEGRLNKEGIAKLLRAQIRAFFVGFGFFAKRLWPIGYVALRKTEPTKKSSNLAHAASFATPSKLFWAFIFLIPFQARFYKFLKPLSFSWIDPSWQLPAYFEPLADLFISDFLLLVLFFGRFEFRHAKYLGLFLGVSLFSIIMSDYGTYPIHYWRWMHLALASLLVCLLGYCDVKKIAFVVMLSGILECGVAIPQYLMQHQIGLKIAGEQTLVSKHVMAPHFHMPKKSVTSLDYVLTTSHEPTNVLRASGTLPHPNILGGFLVFSLLMTCYLYERSRWIGAAIVLQILALFMSFSRAAIFAFIGGMLVWFFMYYLKEKRLCKLYKPLIIGVALSLTLLFPQLFYRGGVVSYNELSLKSDVMRISMHEVALKIIQDHPWFGVGFNNYLLAFANYTHGLEVDSIAVHNIYLLIAAETGLIGLALFLTFCGVVVRNGWRQRGSLEGQMLLALFLAFLAIGLVDYYPMVFQQTRLIFFLTAGLIAYRSKLTQSLVPA